MPSVRTINYAAPPAGHFWQWSGDYDAIEWSDGTTLGMWQEIHGILAYIGESAGIPPLGSLLLLLGACRDDWASRRASNHACVRSLLGIAPDAPIPPEIAATLVTSLDSVHALPKDLRSSFSAKCHLASAIFSGGPHSLLRKDSEMVVAELALPSRKDLANHDPEFDAKARFTRDLRALRIGLERHGAESLENLLRTGIERGSIVAAPLEEEPIAEKDPRLLLETLIAAGGESRAAAMVAKRAIAMINFPGHVGTPRDLPIGGIADITNRGTIDRLLPGELAWDDLVLAARLVHNEALYFRREIPPQNVAVAHTILLDRELRLWGVGRIFSLGVALGLWHHPALNAPGETFECVAATAEDFEYLELNREDQVKAALATLVPAAGPNPFLMRWWDAARIVDDPAVPDVSLIMDGIHLGDAATRTILGEISAWIGARGGQFRIIALDRKGNLEVQVWMSHGHRTLFRGELDLTELLREESSAPESKPPPLPLLMKPRPVHPVSQIYDLDRIPFLFPVSPLHGTFFPDKANKQKGGIGISTDKRLMEWPKEYWGGLELCAAPPGTSHWVGRDDDGLPIVVAAAEKVGGSVRIFRYAGREGLQEIPVVSSRHAFPRRAYVSGGAVILGYHDNAEAISLVTGHRVDEISLLNSDWNGRLWFDGEKIGYVPGEDDQPPSTVRKTPPEMWPRMIVPEEVAIIVRGGLRVTSGREMFEFRPLELGWVPVSDKKATMTAFQPKSLPDGGSFMFASIGKDLEVWYDSRGILHLKSARLGGESYAILMCTRSAVWHPRWDLFSLDPRLLPPGRSITTGNECSALRDFLATPEFQSSF